jgi:gluconokinase
LLVLVMGVAGAGKTLIGSMLAQSLGWEFRDADSFHPPSNVEKMTRGIPLTDADREPWLKAIHDALARWAAEGRNAVVTSSALKQSYRDLLCAGCNVKLVYLRGDYDLIHSRLATRAGHFMKPEMLASQFADLEEPANAIVVDISRSPQEIVAEIRRKLGESSEAGAKL